MNASGERKKGPQMNDPVNQANGADVVARLNDPRNDPRSNSFDRAFATETDRLSQMVWGGGSAAAPAAGPGYPAAPAIAAGAPPTDADVRARLNDLRNDPMSNKFDRAFATETDRLSQQVWGGAPSANPNSPASGQGSQVPAEINGYSLRTSEVLAPFVQNFESDGLFNDVRQAARAAGLTQAQFASFVTPVLEKIAQLDDTPADFTAERAKLIPASARHLDPRAQHVEASRRVEAAISFMERDAVAAGLDREVAEHVIAQLGDSALGIRAMEFFARLR
jgi:hypothetical protein